METNIIKTVKTDSSVTGITENYLNAVHSIIAKIKAKNYVIKINNQEVQADALADVTIDVSNLTHSGRKNMAKRIWAYNKRGNIRSMNFLFHVLGKLGVTPYKVKVDVSLKEQEIIKTREAYKKLKVEAETARVLYATTKGSFYK